MVNESPDNMLAMSITMLVSEESYQEHCPERRR